MIESLSQSELSTLMASEKRGLEISVRLKFVSITWLRFPLYFRPSSDVVLLPCRTKLQFGSTVARQEIYSDSDVVPESNQIQGLLEPRNNSPPNSPRERNLARTY